MIWIVIWAAGVPLSFMFIRWLDPGQSPPTLGDIVHQSTMALLWPLVIVLTLGAIACVMWTGTK